MDDKVMRRCVVIAAAIAMLGNIPLMGLPGALIWTLFSPVVDLLPTDLVKPVEGDSVWGVAIMITVLWPISIPLGYYLSSRWYGPRTLARRLTWLAIMVAWGGALSLGIAFIAA